jgi:hypothetical protein
MTDDYYLNFFDSPPVNKIKVCQKENHRTNARCSKAPVELWNEKPTVICFYFPKRAFGAKKYLKKNTPPNECPMFQSSTGALE